MTERFDAVLEQDQVNVPEVLSSFSCFLIGPKQSDRKWLVVEEVARSRSRSRVTAAQLLTHRSEVRFPKIRTKTRPSPRPRRHRAEPAGNHTDTHRNWTPACGKRPLCCCHSRPTGCAFTQMCLTSRRPLLSDEEEPCD